ncbi:uroplakin-1a [Scyliorhinus canicula]|uniref:uroplakin-1a n=1 Tax=Scyliorhinus canicula TaxID=7830 RepID=UPI0018F4F98A|nr:uroplakin-1a [Scyliorhinus canicula]XP_038669411.1 uroplakin-1a [Scyliorhinus canicula]XP_038669412.1 uroplakin-1a [Scyliorhinus canicula]XP_038669413.1 uroplakin-1a [Scyliorhinus canicula]
MGETSASPFFRGVLIIGKIILMLASLALFAETIWVVTDQFRIYPVLGASGKDDVFAGAWIAIFVGFAFFCLSVFGILAVLSESRTMVITYLVLMIIVYIFEAASCITAITHRDYLTSNPKFVKKQMLQFYGDTATNSGRDLTVMWNRVMQQEQCCGSTGPMDWIKYTSFFRSQFNETTAPWPFQCCKRNVNSEIANQEGCVVGHRDFLYQKGCFDYISTSINSYAWGVAWFGFAILMWTFVVLLMTMYYLTTL